MPCSMPTSANMVKAERLRRQVELRLTQLRPLVRSTYAMKKPLPSFSTMTSLPTIEM
jgi:hypothetical protein